LNASKAMSPPGSDWSFLEIELSMKLLRRRLDPHVVASRQVWGVDEIVRQRRGLAERLR